MKKRVKWVFITVAIAAVAAYFLRPQTPEPVKDAGALVSTRTASVEEAVATPGRIRSALLTYGVIEPLVGIDLAVQSPGQITAVLFKEGDRVQTGQPLVKLDDRTVKAELESAKAASLHDRTVLDRSMRLAEKGIKSTAAVDDSRTSLARSQASEQVRATDLSLMTVTAPFTGVIGPSKVGVGSFVSSGQKIAHLEDRSRLRVTFRLPERMLPLLHPGLAIEATAESIGSQVLKGVVTIVDTSSEPDSRAVLLRASFDNVEGAASPGLFVHINVILSERSDALLIPRQALVASLSGNFVYRIDHGVAHRVKVTLGEREGDSVEVVAGLKAGDHVVAAGQFKLEEGIAVETVPYTPNR